ncbi:DUF2953 domain-containing protein [Oceanirhabdus sp. W0125-5]|uniref:DUF2953 domain-containing protein n=1 Tax=Oceanirhabdus sp. W0125-5 TaxID=2999116 RepID=UPI0022F2F862|nr:DUF2953 domain-containing protein [Oceanirhabdus sp. W0125-5]WBW95301.1 DUF2953 domain-containing protein [Oceanirhabdus sp. W0125-5]
MNLYITFFVLLIILFFPIPLKLSLNYSNSILIICIYKFEILNTGKEKAKTKEDAAKKTKKKKKSIKTKDKRETKERKFDIKSLIFSFLRSDSKFIRTFMKFDLSFQYGLEDAFNCALLYGIISSFLGILPNLINNFFNLKKYDFKVKPLFNIKTMNIKIYCTIYFNLIYIIYVILYILINSRVKKKKNEGVECYGSSN